MTPPNHGDLSRTGETPMLPADEFYIGYFKAPPVLARFLRRVLPAPIVVAVAVAWFVSRSQNDPGDAVWNSGVAREFVGVVEATPYPHLRVPSSQPGQVVETLFLVEVGKFGGGQRAARFSGKSAQISGWILERDGRRMLEMEPGDTLASAESLPDADATRLRARRVVTLGQVTLRGEIVDSKCYLGAMKPGAGKTHKECATLCIAGGIPPMFVTLDEAGRRCYYLLTNPAGEALDDRILPFVADAIEISGVLERRDDLQVLKIDPGSIRRL